MNKVLFITLSNIGDAIMTTPVLEYIHMKYPKAKVDIVCDKKSQEIFMYCPYVNKIYLKNKKSGIFGIIKLIFELRKNNYIFAVDLRTDFLLLLLRSKEKKYKIKNNMIHSVEKHFLAVNNELNKIPNLKLWIPKKITTNIKNIIKKNGKKILTIGLGANSLHKIWPLKNYILLAEKLVSCFDQIILIGDKQDKYISDEFIKKSKIKATNYCGFFSLMETASIIKLSDFFVGNDSGLGHIASALNVPNYIIFGKENVNRYHPWGKTSNWFQDPEKNINNIDSNFIYEKIKKII